MRRAALLLLLVAVAGAPARAQDAVATDSAAIDMPELIGGLGSIASDLEYPVTAHAAGAEGRVVVAFTVTETGTVEEAEITSSVHPALDREALAAVRRARFVPAHRAGRPLRVRMELPVTFELPRG